MFFNKSDNGGAPKKQRVLPLLPLRDIIVFPHMVVPLFVGREKSIAALEEAMAQDKEILLAAQKKAKTNDPTPDDIYTMGTVGSIEQMLRLPDGTVKVMVLGKRRARIKKFVPSDDFFLCEVENVEDKYVASVELEALTRSVQSTFETYVKLNKRIAPETLMQVQTIDDPVRLADAIVVHLSAVKLHDKQEILETTDAAKRLERLFELMNAEIEILNVEKKIRSRVKKQMEKTQKEYYLNEQMQAIQKELGERDEFKSEIQELEEKIKTKKLSKEAEGRVKKELRKLKMMQPMSAEATVVRNYIDWVLNLPWEDKSEENYDIEAAERILDEDHYGLKKVKERVLEYLAVQALVRKLKGPVLCLVGPPGVGKTSLARSIARSTGRKFVRLSLGGVRDEAEIRGHRRTYIGALPGRIIQSLRKAGANNPVFLLDEIDKMSSDFRGDPAAALLEVLDPEQNKSFNDHYLDLDYDLSDVMFITTANSLGGIPMPLRDRMEIIELSGYTEFEKLNIAVRYLVPRQKQEAGLEQADVDLTENAIRTIIHHYTKESGVRNLEREIGSVCRKVARQVLKDQQQGKTGLSYRIAAKNVPQYLGVPRFRSNKTSEHDEVGLTNGLAYTTYGGTILECEVSVVPGKGKLVITGLLEKGMQESAQAAMSYIRSRQQMLGLASKSEDGEDFHSKVDVHVHFPEFVPKDGPSAGVTIATSIASALMKIPVRRTVAMTGEITLRGRVMPIGGLKEKMLAAHRAGIQTILVPRENRKDLREIPKRVLNAMRVVLVEHMDEVLREALVLSDPDAVFGKRVRPMEYVGGRLVEHGDGGEGPGEGVPTPTVEAPGAQQ
ncbi:endopeptidase La [Sandaracinus amylolyticus]|uniref:Lon protease n=1 Tax=Sandaracinus amylolyticus TaxID=927083 RepID=A0A0F6W350_9BACT|nr:endopeptidase La [Sandaracinus amylolyticus]AKF06287.1 ATP-dependent protease La [Sandaracinus amylolyticus]